jgi:hypothetical protein
LGWALTKKTSGLLSITPCQKAWKAILKSVEERAGMEKMLNVFFITRIRIGQNMIGLYVIMISLITEERMRICKLYIQF